MNEDEWSNSSLSFASFFLNRSHWIPIGFVFISISLLIISGILLYQSTHVSEPIRFSSSTASSSGSLRHYIVDVNGAVVRPGVYTFPVGSRVVDAVKQAGGFSPEADQEWIALTINQAQLLTDGMKIFIYSKDRNKAVQTVSGQTTVLGASAVSNSSNSIYSINRATLSELDQLPGIGAVTGQKIISNRPYQSLDELITKHVVSQSVFEKIRERISL